MSNHYEDTIWKQITTCCFVFCADRKLWAIITKIQSESKSQLNVELFKLLHCCEQSLRRYNLKANHNNALCDVVGGYCCEQSLRRYNLKANHNVTGARQMAVNVVSNHYEDTIWKQITTHLFEPLQLQSLWAIITKIQSESKSQQALKGYAGANVVSNHYEDTIWKQITTKRLYIRKRRWLWAIITKIQSESKSQLPLPLNPSQSGCEQSLRRYNLKANHNA